jgi:hypothetical protein
MTSGSFDHAHAFPRRQQPLSERMTHLTRAEQSVQLSVRTDSISDQRPQFGSCHQQPPSGIAVGFVDAMAENAGSAPAND